MDYKDALQHLERFRVLVEDYMLKMFESGGGVRTLA